MPDRECQELGFAAGGATAKKAKLIVIMQRFLCLLTASLFVIAAALPTMAAASAGSTQP